MSNFTGLLSHRVIKFNKRKERDADATEKEETEKSTGPLVDDRKCSRCGHMGMTYSTMQTRSVDEGQTVFYHCPDSSIKKSSTLDESRL